MKIFKLLIVVFLSTLYSCDSGSTTEKVKTVQEYKVLITKLLLSGNEILLEAAPLVDDDVASIAHFTYADSLFTVVKDESKSDNFEQSLAKMYTGSAHVFFGMAYKSTLFTHAQFPIMNFLGVRKARMEHLDTTFYQYLHENNPTTVIQLKNDWLAAMIDFFKVRQHPLYDRMKADYADYITLNDSINAAYNKEDAGKIMMLESEKQLFKQLMYITMGTFENNSDKTALLQFYEEGNKMAAVYNQLPAQANALLLLNKLEYYTYFYYSEIVVYNLLRQISINLNQE